MSVKDYGNKKITDTKQTNEKSSFSGWKLVRILIILACVGLVIWMGIKIAQALKPTFQYVTKKTTEVVSQQIGIEPIYDESGNLNVLLMGYGGKNHPGGFLTDSIMVASFNPQKGTATMISIPRDLYIKKKGHHGKINSLFSSAMIATGYRHKDINEALGRSAKKAINTIEDITGLKIPYYALVSFDGFKKFINDMGGITIDVPERLVDRSFPNDNMTGYMTLVVEKGVQQMDGMQALRYARSRHSTSDFSRAYRQQLIIKAVIAKIKESISITNISGIETMYKNYTNMVTTNLSLKNLLNLVQYKDKLSGYSSYVLSYECGRYYTQMSAGCFLAPTPRKWFGSALAPIGYTYRNLGNYKKINDFARLVTKFSGIKSEEGSIAIYNAINPKTARTKRINLSGKANTVASKLVQHGFTVKSIANSKQYRPRTVVYIYNNKPYNDTLDALKTFMDIDVYTGQILSGEVHDNPLELYLGDNFLDNYTTNRLWK